MLIDHVADLDDGELAPSPRVSRAVPSIPMPRHGYETPGGSRIAGIVATATICLLVAIAATTTLNRIDNPPPVLPPLTVMLLPSDAHPTPTPVKTPKVVPRRATRSVPRDTPLPPPIVMAPPTPRAAAEASPAAIDPAPPRPDVTPAPAPAQPVEASHGPDRWEGRVLARLERFRRYPADAQHTRQQGTVTIRCRIARDGHVLSSSLDHSSGYPALDDAALETLHRADPFPKIPADRPDEIELVVPIEFSLAR